MINEFFLLVCWLLIFTPSIAATLNQLPFASVNGNAHIKATLLDQLTQEKWTLDEYLVQQSTTYGKISINSGTSSMDVNYNTEQQENRLVIYNNLCTKFSIQDDDWSSLLPGVKNKLINELLLIGPSVYLRLRNALINWNQCTAKKIREVSLQCSQTLLSGNLRVILYHQAEYRVNPLRIVMQRSTLPDKSDLEHVILDLYLKEYTLNQFDALPKLGIGCPSYLESYKSLPIPPEANFHFVVTESSKSSAKSPYFLENKMEIWADTAREVVHFINTKNNVRVSGIFDYKLCVAYLFQGGCLRTAITYNTLGIVDEHLNAYNLLQLSVHASYVGVASNEHIWETTEYNQTIYAAKFDKVVTTAYYIKTKISGEDHYTLLYVARNAYKKFTSGEGYTWVFSQSFDYFNFDNITPETLDQQLFQVSDCYDDPDQQLELVFEISATEDDKIAGLKYAETNIYEMKKAITERIISRQLISATRIASIDIDFDNNKILAKVKFNEAPELTDSFSKSPIVVDVEKYRPVSVSTLKECFEIFSDHYNVRGIVYCATGNCFKINQNQMAVGDAKGERCYLYTLASSSITRILNETPLKNIHTKLLAQLGKLNIFLTPTHQYNVDNIVDYSISSGLKQIDQLFRIVYSGYTLDSNNPMVIDVSSNVNSFADCYKLCQSSENYKCETFSYCQNDLHADCRISSYYFTGSRKENFTEADDSCYVYRKNSLSDYHKSVNRKFIHVLDTPERTFNIETCAENCLQSEECHAFQYCGDGSCSKATLSESKVTESAQDCSIYISKALHNFALTGTTLVVDYYAEELSLDLENCANLCYHNQGDGNQTCKSFNYCPKGAFPSKCQLTNHFISDKNVKTNSSVLCRNYQTISIIDFEDDDENNDLDAAESVSISRVSVFGIIIVFIAVGLLFGTISQFIYTKRKQKKQNASSNIGEVGFSEFADQDD